MAHITSVLSAAGLLLVLLLAPGLGCASTLVFNPSFVNTTTGDVFPLTPGDRSGFVLVRGNNSTQQAIEFVVTAERQVISQDNPDETMVVTETYHLLTQPQNQSNDLGVLIECPVLRVGLGENIDRPQTEPGVFIGATAVGVGGFGVPAGINPLDTAFGNFDCGDTIIYRAAEAGGAVGGVVVAAFVLDDETQPTQIQGIDTFVNTRSLIEEQQQERD